MTAGVSIICFNTVSPVVAKLVCGIETRACPVVVKVTMKAGTPETNSKAVIITAVMHIFRAAPFVHNTFFAAYIFFMYKVYFNCLKG